MPLSMKFNLLCVHRTSSFSEPAVDGSWPGGRGGGVADSRRQHQHVRLSETLWNPAIGTPPLPLDQEKLDCFHLLFTGKFTENMQIILGGWWDLFWKKYLDKRKINLETF